jgi:hypothetical protein
MHELPVPGHFDSSRVGEVWRVPYEQRAHEARQWAVQHRLTAAADDSLRVCLLAVDVQNTCHCLAWTIDDLPQDHQGRTQLAQRTYLLEDCTSPVVVPGAIDYTSEAAVAFERYAAAGMHVVRSTDRSASGRASPSDC